MSTCRYCQFPGAYDSGFKVECPNPDCQHFSLEQCKEFITTEIRWGCARAISGESVSPLPAPFTAEHPSPFILAVSWPQPKVVKELQITWHFTF